MKNILFIIGLIGISIAYLPAQFRVSEWMLGPISTTTAHKLDFATGNAVYSPFNYNLRTLSHAPTISNAAHDLLLYSNGVVLMNGNYQIIPNSINFNGGYMYANDSISANCFLTLFVPAPGDTNQFYVLHQSTKYVILHPQYGYIPSNIRYSIVDIAANAGQGEVIIKDSILIEDTLSIGKLSVRAVRHANGRDWWMIIPRVLDYGYYTALITPQGITDLTLKFMESTPVNLPTSTPLGQSIGNIFLEFAPNGIDCIVRRGFYYGGYTYDSLMHYQFDRCTGVLSNPRKVTSTMGLTSNLLRNFCFSANSKCLYIFQDNVGIWQFNLEDAFPDSTKVLVYSIPPQSQYITLVPSPDELKRIYFFNGPQIGMIQYPNIVGLGCNATPNQIQITPPYQTGYYPYYPNYSLGPLIGSGCDTLTSSIGTAVTAAKVEVYPNPTDGEITVVLLKTLSTATFTLYSAQGVKLGQWECTNTDTHIAVDKFPSGMYFYTLDHLGTVLYTHTLSIQ